MTPPNRMTIEELARQLGRDVRIVEKLASKGKIPGRKVNSRWEFQSTEIREWIENNYSNYSEGELAALEKSQQSEHLDESCPVSTLLTPETIEIPLQARTKRSVMERLVEVAGRTWHVWSPEIVLKATLDREDLMSTAFDEGVAIPHPRSPLPNELGESVMALGITSRGIPFGGGRELTDVFFLVLCRDARTHLQILARLGRLIRTPDFLAHLREAESPEEAWDFISQTEQSLSL